MEQFFVNDVKFNVNLRNVKSATPTMVYVVLSFKGKQYKVTTHTKVLPTQFRNGWAMTEKKMDAATLYNNNIVNKKIIEYKALFSNLISYLCANEGADMQTAIQKIFYKTDKPLRLKSKNKAMKQGVTISSVLTKGNLQHSMKESSRELNNTEIKLFTKWLDDNGHNDLSEVSTQLMADYFKYMSEQKVTHKITHETVYLADNSVILKLKKIQAICEYVKEIDVDVYNKYFKDVDYKLASKGSKPSKNEENQVYLSNDEVDRLIALDEELDDLEKKVRDVFVVQLESGQRFSDIVPLLGKELAMDDNSITLIQQKTGKKVNVPFTERSKAIILKYNKVLPVVTISQMDRKIKGICKAAKITEKVQCAETRNHEIYSYIVEKWQLISSHSARRSFISEGLKTMDGKVLSKITGHSGDGSFDRYNRLSSKDATDIYLQKKQGKEEEKKATIGDIDIRSLPNEVKVMIYRQKLEELTNSPQPWSMMTDEEIIKIYEK